MTPELWQQVDQLYYSALEREPGQRSAFLVEACAGDEELRRLAGRYQESIDAAQESLALNPDSLRAYVMIGASLEQMGKLGEAITFFGKACCLYREDPPLLGWLGHAYGVAGRVEEATAILKNLRRRRARHCFFAEALVALGLGNLPETFASLERACEEREFSVVLLRADARFAPLQATSEFRSILSRIGLAS